MLGYAFGGRGSWLSLLLSQLLVTHVPVMAPVEAADVAALGTTCCCLSPWSSLLLSQLLGDPTAVVTPGRARYRCSFPLRLLLSQLLVELAAAAALGCAPVIDAIIGLGRAYCPCRSWSWFSAPLSQLLVKVVAVAALGCHIGSAGRSSWVEPAADAALVFVQPLCQAWLGPTFSPPCVKPGQTRCCHSSVSSLLLLQLWLSCCCCSTCCCSRSCLLLLQLLGFCRCCN